MHISVAGPAQFVVFLGQQTAKQRDVEQGAPALSPVAASSSVNAPPLCSHSQRMLKRISALAISSIR